MPKIIEIKAKKILDSTGNWTIEARVTGDDGSFGVASVPSGESAGKFEAKKVTVEQGVSAINGSLGEKLLGKEIDDLVGIDNFLIQMDGTADKSGLGANTVLAVSEAVAEAGAKSRKVPLYQFLAETFGISAAPTIPTPLFNILEGGRHANNELYFQEYLFIPSLSVSYTQKLEAGIVFYRKVRESLLKDEIPFGIGDEGGLAVHTLGNDEVLSRMLKVTEDEGLEIGKNAYFGLDAAAGQFFREGYYYLKKLGRGLSPIELKELYDRLMKVYPITYLEDPFVEEDSGNWARLVVNYGQRTEIVGDDLTTTNLARMEQAAADKEITAIIIKPNQVGTVSETVKTARRAKELGLTVIASHRGAETASSFIADLAVAIGAKYVKFGGLSRGERVAKYNRMLEIEKEIG